MDETRGGSKARNVGLEMDLRIPPAPSLAQLNEQKRDWQVAPQGKAQECPQRELPWKCVFSVLLNSTHFHRGKVDGLHYESEQVT